MLILEFAQSRFDDILRFGQKIALCRVRVGVERPQKSEKSLKKLSKAVETGNRECDPCISISLHHLQKDILNKQSSVHTMFQPVAAV